MAAPRLLPPISTLVAWRDEGLTHADMVQRIYERDGVVVARSTVSAALSRSGKTNPVRYESIPDSWRPISLKHQGAYDLMMLRTLGRVAEGKPLPRETRDRLEAWKKNLRDDDCVVAYIRESEYGFYRVKRRPGHLDREYTRGDN